VDRDFKRSADDTIRPHRIWRQGLTAAKLPARPAAATGGFARWIYLVPLCAVLLGGLGFAILRGRPPPAAPPAPVPAAQIAAPIAPLVIPAPEEVGPPSMDLPMDLRGSVAPAPSFYLPFAREPEILANQATSLSIFRLAENPAILVLDFPSLGEQARMLNRAAVLVETRGQPRDRLLGDVSLEQAIRATGAQPDTFYDGHDYRASDLVRFFALAERDGIRLNPDELRLRDLIRAAGWTDAGAVGALITLPALGVGIDPQARASILRHEISHGVFFTDPAYAAFTQRFWQTELNDKERAAFRRFLASQEYDPADETLMMNETQAYLVHTADRRFFNPDLVGLPPERLAALRARFVAGMPAGWFRDMTIRDQRP
jgi:hypothetical protein